MTDSSEWGLIEETVFRLFDELTAAAHPVAIRDQLSKLGFADIQSQYPTQAYELLFRAQGRSLVQTDCLYLVMIAELSALRGESVDAVLLPAPACGTRSASTATRVEGLLLGPSRGRIAVPVRTNVDSLALVDAAQLSARRIDTFDPTVYWTHVTGTLNDPLTEAGMQWTRALCAAQRALATELVTLADQVLRLAIEHVSTRKQFGVAIGSFQSPRHALASALATVEAARSLSAEAWRCGDSVWAQSAKAAAGRAHRVASDVALQVCGAIGLTAEHDMHRYVRRGFQLDALCGSAPELEAQIAQRLFDEYPSDHGLPIVVA